MMHATVLGASGYTGMVLLRILAHHPSIDFITASARSTAGRPLAQADPGLGRAAVTSARFHPTVLDPGEALSRESDVVFSCLPHGASATVLRPILGRLPVIDLSADFRFSDGDRFERAYGAPWHAPEFQSQSVYGLVEWTREAISRTSLVASPGCYPTAALLPLLPLAAAGLLAGPIVVNAVSGITGAGRKESLNLLYAERSENANAYNVGTAHRHHAEIVEQLAGYSSDGSEPRLFFNPHLVPLKQGMAATITVPVSHARAAVDAIRSRYENEPFVELTGTEAPQTRHVRGTNLIRIGWREEGDYLVLMSVIDNLWKGAAGQAVQSMNVRFGWDETSGLVREGDL